MTINKIRAQNFRNVESCEIEFTPGVNLLYGNNAQGKTNIIEAIYYFSRGKSFRLSSDDELKRMGEDGYFVQEYTIHISPPIYPEDGLNYRKNMTKMMEKNYELWKEIYEREYQIPLTYTTEKQEKVKEDV